MDIGRLQKVKEAILNNPHNFCLSSWVSNITGVTDHQGIELKKLSNPECGTTACIAGWIVYLFGDRDEWEKKRNINFQERAAQLLDIPERDIDRGSKGSADRLFHRSQWPAKFSDAYMDAFELKDSEKSHKQIAQITADRIDHFIKTGY